MRYNYHGVVLYCKRYGEDVNLFFFLHCEVAWELWFMILFIWCFLGDTVFSVGDVKNLAGVVW